MPIHQRQRGFKKTPGCAENLAIIKNLHKRAKQMKSGLAAVFIDLARAFDTVAHDLILRVLQAKKVDKLITNLIRSCYTGSTTQLKTSKGLTDLITLKSGVKQGDPLSPSLFNLALDPLLYTLDRECTGVEFGDDQAIKSLAYADDLVLVGEDWSDIQRALNVLTVYLETVGLAANPEKCFSFFLSTIPGHLLGPVEGVTVVEPVEQLKDLLEKLGRAELKPSQKIALLRQFMIPTVTYKADHGDLKVGKLREMDKLIRKKVKQWLHLEGHTTDGIIYSKFSDGGLNITKLESQILATRTRRLLSLRVSEDPTTNTLVGEGASKREVERAWKTLTGSLPRSSVDDLNIKEISSERIKRKEFDKWTKHTWQGSGKRYRQLDKEHGLKLVSSGLVISSSCVGSTQLHTDRTHRREGEQDCWRRH
ncbi:hypothetical protein WMY93_029851 [Mugilogobius chulae]|uniref:ribonuclease H n=1 Tax=Mugilogobius chulae TaxID=88201 RepID=A0AAW0MW46_9GOBI